MREGWEEVDGGSGNVVLVNVVIEAGLGKTISFAWENQKVAGVRVDAPKL